MSESRLGGGRVSHDQHVTAINELDKTIAEHEQALPDVVVLADIRREVAARQAHHAEAGIEQLVPLLSLELAELEQLDEVELAVRQWEGLASAIHDAGGEVVEQPPQPGLPDLVFTRNAGLTWGDRALLSRFRFEERRAEQPHDRAAFESLGLAVQELPMAPGSQQMHLSVRLRGG